MQKYQVKSSGDALAYIVDCNLATVSSMAMLRSRTKYEYQRQISIAQAGLGWLVDYGSLEQSSRAKEVVEKFASDVKAWADQYDVKAIS